MQLTYGGGTPHYVKILVKTYIKPKVIGLDNLDRIFKRCKFCEQEPASYAGIKASAENMVLTEVRTFFRVEIVVTIAPEWQCSNLYEFDFNYSEIQRIEYFNSCAV